MEEMDKVLKALGINTNGVKYEDMSEEEHDTLRQMLSVVERNELTIDKLRNYIHMLRDIVEQKVTSPDLTERQDLYYKARLENLRLIEAFLLGPERAKKALELSIQRLK